MQLTLEESVGPRTQWWKSRPYDLPTGPTKDGELTYKKRTVGTPTRALKGPAATTLFLSSLPEVTRMVTYIDPTVASQFTRNKPIAFARAIADGFISTRNTWDSTSTSPGLEANTFLAGPSCDRTTKPSIAPPTASIEIRTELFVVGSTAKAEVSRK